MVSVSSTCSGSPCQQGSSGRHRLRPPSEEVDGVLGLHGVLSGANRVLGGCRGPGVVSITNHICKDSIKIIFKFSLLNSSG